MRRVLKALAFVLAGVVALILVGVLVFTSTDFGRERVRRIALSILRDRVNGQVQVLYKDFRAGIPARVEV